MEATTKDLRLHTNAVLAAVDRGETVIVTFRGRKRAVLTRWCDEKLERAEQPAHNPAFGIWRDRDEDVDAQVRRLRQPRELT